MLKTLVYADIFDYPLTRAELNQYLIAGDVLPSIKKKFYFLPGKNHLIKLRRRRLEISRQKWLKAKKFVRILSLIPWIKLVCVTGALAMNNAEPADDIDLMIVTSANRLWLTRLLVLIFGFPWLRRGRKINDRLCFNLWLDETALPLKERNLYTAHELCQAKPIFDRDNTYQKFIQANLWYKRFLPNWTI